MESKSRYVFVVLARKKNNSYNAWLKNEISFLQRDLNFMTACLEKFQQKSKQFWLERSELEICVSLTYLGEDFFSYLPGQLWNAFMKMKTNLNMDNEWSVGEN